MTDTHNVNCDNNNAQGVESVVATPVEVIEVVDNLEQSSLPQEVLGDAYDTLKKFYVKLRNEGELRGLIGPRELSRLWERHILNSAALAPEIRNVVNKRSSRAVIRVADVGSGGGFPGIILAAMFPAIQFTLIEPMERRVEWLQECVEELSLDNVQVVRGRAQDVNRHNFDIVTCRAVAPLSKLVGFTLPLLASHGQLLALKGRSAQEEIAKAKQALRQHHGMNPRVITAPVGGNLESTHIVSVIKA